MNDMAGLLVILVMIDSFMTGALLVTVRGMRKVVGTNTEAIVSLGQDHDMLEYRVGGIEQTMRRGGDDA